METLKPMLEIFNSSAFSVIIVRVFLVRTWLLSFLCLISTLLSTTVLSTTVFSSTMLSSTEVIASESSKHKPYDIRIAVASNFYTTLAEIVKAFEQESYYRVSLSSGSSGILSTQILRGAPFDLFFSADQERIELLVKEGLITDGDTAIYAQGRLLLALKSTVFVDEVWCGLSDQALFMKKPTQFKIALAKPELAPYGKASFALLNKQFPLSIKNKQLGLVYGNNISQVAQYFSEGAVDAAWLSVSMKELLKNNVSDTCFYEPAIESYPEILQGMAILQKNNPAALAFWQFIQTEQAKAIIQQSGYVDGRVN